MSVRINVSFQEDWEADDIMELLKPILPGFKVKKGKGTGVYKHLYIMPRDVERSADEAKKTTPSHTTNKGRTKETAEPWCIENRHKD